MVYRGKPSAGCENCRKAKKRCGLEQPACSRCVKLKKTCSGYRDTNALQIQDESASVIQKANRQKNKTPAPTGNGFLAPDAAPRVENGLSTPAPSTAHTPFSEASSSSDDTVDIPMQNSGDLMTFDALREDDSDMWTLDPPDESIPMSLIPPVDEIVTSYFFSQFTTANGHWSIIREVMRAPTRIDPVLDFAMKACGMAALDNVQGVPQGREYHTVMYGEALSRLNASLRDTRRSKTDESLIAVSLLGYYENLTCDSRQSIQSWKAHIEGTTQLLKLRGKGQFKTAVGRMLFRHIRANILIHCIWDDLEPAAFLWDWEKEMEKHTEADNIGIPTDIMSKLCYRFATLRNKMRYHRMPEAEALDEATQLEMEFVQWSIDTMQIDLWRYREVEVPDSPSIWDGVAHSYAWNSAANVWNTYRSMRIMLTRTQEMLVRKLQINISEEDPQLAYFRSVRRQMADEICSSIPTQLGHSAKEPTSQGVLITAYSSVWPLFFAGTCTLERIANSAWSGAAPRITSAAAAQTSWIIARMEYISKEVGLRWADGIAATLKGDFAMHEDLMDSEDKKYITLYWREKSLQEQKEGRIASGWLKKVRDSGRGPKILMEQESPLSDALDRPRSDPCHGPIWLGRAAGENIRAKMGT